MFDILAAKEQLSALKQTVARLEMCIDVFEKIERRDLADDKVNRFLMECCALSDFQEVTKSELYKRYLEWSLDNRFVSMSHKAFSSALQKTGLKSRRSGKAHYWQGVGLHENGC